MDTSPRVAMSPVTAHEPVGPRAAQVRTPREVRAVIESLDAAGTRVVLLHPADGFGTQHDIDIAVDQPIERVEPTIVGALQEDGYEHITTLEYDVGGSASLVFGQVVGAGFRSVAIDVVHDPRGIGRYGIPMAPVLRSSTLREGVPSPTPGWEAVYLLSKRIRKGGWERKLHSLPGLLDGAFEDFERAARVVMGRSWASRLVARNADGATVVRSAAEAARIKRAITIRRLARDPWNPVRRVARTARRLRRPTGLYVTICGVDGTGKSTLAGRLSEELGPAFRRTLRLHWRPDLLPRLGAIVGRPAPDADRPHEGEPSGTFTGLIRLLYYWMDHVLGYWLRIWPARVRSGLVIMERGFLDIKVDPRRYRLRAAGSLIDLLAKAVPRPDVELVLAAPPDLVHRRKRELSGGEVRRQVEEWARIASGSDRARLLDAGQTAPRVLEHALRSILERHR